MIAHVVLVSATLAVRLFPSLVITILVVSVPANAVLVWLATLLTTFAIAVGLIFLILPGILIAIWLSLVAQAIVIDRKSWGSALNRSYDLVRRRSLGVVALLLGVIVLQALGLFVAPTALGPSADSLFSWGTYVAWDVVLGPFIGTLYAVLYYHLVALERDEPEPSFALA